MRVTEVLPAVEVFDVAVGRDTRRLRPERGRLGPAAGPRAAGRATRSSVRHAEVLEDGELGVRPLRTAKATDTYVLAGDADEVTLEPRVDVPRLPLRGDHRRAADLRARTSRPSSSGPTCAAPAGSSRSDELLNRFHENVVWGMRGNFVDVPTDCPQRDERLGWTGDIQVFAPTATFLYDSAGFLTSWLADLAAEQQPDGSVPVRGAGRASANAGPAAAAWGDAATVVPWVLYERSGDAGVLARQLPSMRAWVDRMADLAGDDRLWAGGFQFGDWLDPTAPPEDPGRRQGRPGRHRDRAPRAIAPSSSREPPRSLGDADDRRAVRATWRPRCASAFAREYITPAAGC